MDAVLKMVILKSICVHFSGFYSLLSHSHFEWDFYFLNVRVFCL